MANLVYTIHVHIAAPAKPVAPRCDVWMNTIKVNTGDTEEEMMEILQSLHSRTYKKSLLH